MGLKILHSADWHLDSPFASFDGEPRAFLQQAQRRIPERLRALCAEEHCDLVLLAGDIFDGPYSRETAALLADALEDCGVPVFISPGNHDFYGPESPWVRENWPANVHIFSGRLSYVDLPELDCRIYGAGYGAMDCPGVLEGFRAEREFGHTVAVLHGDPTGGRSPYCPITASQVRDSGLDYLALGHIHQSGSFRAGDTLCGWPGCPMGRGWDEIGPKGAFLVSLDAQAQIRQVPLGLPLFWDENLRLEEENGLEQLLPPTESTDFYRVTLTGTGEADIPGLLSRFAYLPHLEFRDRTEAPVALWDEIGEDSLRGIFFGMLRSALDRAEPEEAERILLAAEISRKLLDGREVELP